MTNNINHDSDEGADENLSANEQEIISKSKMISKSNHVGRINVKKGRPPNKKGPQKYNQIDHIKNAFIRYLNKIGFKQGLVFSQKQRSKLREQQEANPSLPRITWDSKNTWILQQQKAKIKKILNDAKITNDTSYLSNLFLDSSDIFPREITLQIYQLLSQLYQILTTCQTNAHNLLDSQIVNLVDVLVNHQGTKFVFVNSKFSEKYKSDNLELIETGLEKLCRTIVKQLKMKKNEKIIKEFDR